MSKLDNAVNKKNRYWEELEKTILELAKEMHRLAGKPAYEPLDSSIEKLIQGEG